MGVSCGKREAVWSGEGEEVKIANLVRD